MYRAYKFRLYPNDEQKILINKTFGSSRFVYNYYLNKIKDNGYTSVYNNISDYTNKLKYDATFLQEVDSTVIKNSLFNLERAYKKTFSTTGEYPRFKNKYTKNSYNTTAVYSKYNGNEYSTIELDLKNKLVKLPKLNWLKIRGYRNLKNINGKIISANISKEPTGKYYVSILYKVTDVISNKLPRTIVGIDLGIKKLLTLSTGKIYENNKYIAKYEKRIKRKQKELSRKIKGSENYKKCKIELAKLCSKLSNARKYYTHKITKEITDEYIIITCESLNTKSMIVNGKKNNLSSKITDATFAEIIRQLSYKSKFKGKKFYQINSYYPSSQICSRCDNQDKKYKDLKERDYSCTKCGQVLDRDLNASINIMNEGLKLYLKDLSIS